MLRCLMRMLGVVALLTAVAACGKQAGSSVQATSPAPTGPVDGARLFQRRCAVCHGSTGEGQEMALGAKSANLSDAALQARLTDADLVRIMRNGVGRMPAVSGLRDDQASAIAVHVRSLKKP